MLFCKNLEEIRSPRGGGISRAMACKSTRSEPPAAAKQPRAAEAPPPKIYPIVKYGDPVLEKPAATVKKFDAELGQLADDMFASMYAAQGVGLAAPQAGESIRLAGVDVSDGQNDGAQIVFANPR